MTDRSARRRILLSRDTLLGLVVVLLLAAVLLLVNAAELRFVESNVAYLAHLAGIAAGLAAGLALRLLRHRPHPAK